MSIPKKNKGKEEFFNEKGAPDGQKKEGGKTEGELDVVRQSKVKK